jgi:LPXTG-motif cell wall-anchored protein
VQRPSAPDAIAEVGWTVAAEQAATPLERVTTTAAWLIVAGLAGLGLGLVLRRRRAGDPPPIEARAAVGVRGRP